MKGYSCHDILSVAFYRTSEGTVKYFAEAYDEQWFVKDNEGRCLNKISGTFSVIPSRTSMENFLFDSIEEAHQFFQQTLSEL